MPRQNLGLSQTRPGKTRPDTSTEYSRIEKGEERGGKWRGVDDVENDDKRPRRCVGKNVQGRIIFNQYLKNATP